MANTQGGPLEFEFDIKLQKFEAKLHSVESQLASMTNQAVAQTSKIDKIWAGTMATAAAYFTGQAIGRFALRMVEVRGEFEKLEAVLTNTFGDNSRAKAALSMIQEFASKTPFQVQELTDSFVKMVNQGFEPTIEDMTALGDLASSTGKSFNQLTEAILDAQTMQFERLKEFGIKASKEGDKIIFTFKGQKTEIAATSKSIQEYLIGLGKMEGVTGSMAAISETMVGKISNMKDAWDQLLNTMGNRTEGPIKFAIEQLGNLMTMLNSAFENMESKRLKLITQNASFDFEMVKKEMEAIAAQKVATGMSEKDALKSAMDQKKKDIELTIGEFQSSLDKMQVDLDNWEWIDPKNRTRSDKKQIKALEENIKRTRELLDIEKNVFEAINAYGNTKEGGSNPIFTPEMAQEALKEFEKYVSSQKKAYQQFEAVKETTSLENAQRLYPKLEESYKKFLLRLREQYQDNPAFSGVIATELAPIFDKEELKEIPRIEDFWEKQKSVNLSNYKFAIKTNAEKKKGRMDEFKDTQNQLAFLDGLTEVLNKIDSNFAGWTENIANVVYSLDKIKATDTSTAENIGANMSLFGAMVSAFDQIFSGLQNKGAYDEITAITEKFNNLLSAQLDLIDQLAGTEKLEATLQTLKDMDAQAKSLLSTTNSKVFVDKNQTLGNILGDFYAKDFELKATELLESMKEGKEMVKDYMPNLVQYYDLEIERIETLIGLRQEYNNTQSDLYKDVLGTSFENISDSIRDGFENGLSSVEDFADNTKSIIRKAILESFQTKYLDAQMQAWFNEFGAAAADGLTQDEAAAAKANLETLINTSSTYFEEYKKMMEELGVWTTGDSNQSSLSGAISGIQEDTANVLAGTLNSMRIISLRQAEVMESSMTVLTRIEYNTSFTRYVVDELKAINTKMGTGSDTLLNNRANGW